MFDKTILNDQLFTRTREVKYGTILDYFKYFSEEMENGIPLLKRSLKDSLDEIIRMCNFNINSKDSINDNLDYVTNTVNVSLKEANEGLIHIMFTDFYLNLITINRENNGAVSININIKMIDYVIGEIDNIIKRYSTKIEMLADSLKENNDMISFQYFKLVELNKDLEDTSDSGPISLIENSIKGIYNKGIKKNMDRLGKEMKKTTNISLNINKEIGKEQDFLASLENLKKYLTLMKSNRSMNTILIPAIKNFLKDERSAYHVNFIDNSLENGYSEKLFKDVGIEFKHFINSINRRDVTAHVQ